jgi:hypothetical protein
MGINQKSRLGQVSKAAQVTLHQDLRTSSLKRTADSGNQAFKGEGDAFRYRSRECLVTEALIGTRKAKVQSQRVRVTLLTSLLTTIAGLAHQDQTLPVRGYCWGCSPKATEIPEPELHPLKRTIANLHFFMIPVTHLRIFCEGSQLHGRASAKSGSG